MSAQSDYENWCKCYLIPKLWVKSMKTHIGNMWLFSNTPKPGYHLHPAFYNNKGQEVEQGILIWDTLIRDIKNCLNRVLAAKYTGPVTVNENVNLSEEDAQSIIRELNVREYLNTHIGSVDLGKMTEEERKAFYDSCDAGWHLYNIYEHYLIELLLRILQTNSPSFLYILFQRTTLPFGFDIQRSTSEGNEDWVLYLLDPKTREKVNTGIRIDKELRSQVTITNQTEYYHDKEYGEYVRDILLPKPSEKDNYPILSKVDMTKSFPQTLSDKYGTWEIRRSTTNGNNYFIVFDKNKTIIEGIDGSKAYSYPSGLDAFSYEEFLADSITNNPQERATYCVRTQSQTRTTRVTATGRGNFINGMLAKYI